METGTRHTCVCVCIYIYICTYKYIRSFSLLKYVTQTKCTIDDWCISSTICYKILQSYRQTQGSDGMRVRTHDLHSRLTTQRPNVLSLELILLSMNIYIKFSLLY